MELEVIDVTTKMIRLRSYNNESGW